MRTACDCPVQAFWRCRLCAISQACSRRRPSTPAECLPPPAVSPLTLSAGSLRREAREHLCYLSGAQTTRCGSRNRRAEQGRARPDCFSACLELLNEEAHFSPGAVSAATSQIVPFDSTSPAAESTASFDETIAAFARLNGCAAALPPPVAAASASPTLLRAAPSLGSFNVSTSFDRGLFDPPRNGRFAADKGFYRVITTSYTNCSGSVRRLRR